MKNNLMESQKLKKFRLKLLTLVLFIFSPNLIMPYLDIKLSGTEGLLVTLYFMFIVSIFVAFQYSEKCPSCGKKFFLKYGPFPKLTTRCMHCNFSFIFNKN